METCQYCRAEVPDGLMGYHYAGYKMPPCREVEGALGRWIPKAESGSRGALPPDVYAKSKGHRTCSEQDCGEPVWKAGRCWVHQHAFERAFPSHAKDRKRRRPAELFRERKMTHAHAE
jgi:hypothetical protein